MFSLPPKKLYLVLCFSIFTCGGCQSAPAILLKSEPSAQRLLQQTLKHPLSGKTWLPQAQHVAQKWERTAALMGVYTVQLSGERFVSYEFQAAHNTQENLFVKILADGSSSTRLSEARQISPAVPLAQWQVSAQAALELARKNGFNASDNYGMGLNYWQGMGIPTASLKWSVLSFADADATDYFVIDASTAQVWRCQPTTNPLQGCAPAVQHTQIRQRINSIQ